MAQADTHIDRRRFLSRLSVLPLAGALLPRAGFAQSYPMRPVRLVLPFAAGGGVDISTRIVAEAVAERLGQQFVIENMGGGGTVPATQAVVKAAPDGYTLFAMPTTTVINPAVRSLLPYNWETDLMPVALIVKLPFVVTGGAQLKATTMAELAVLAKASRDPLTFASGGTGTVAHLAGELFAIRAGVKLQHVAYRGEAQAYTDAMGGHLSVMFGSLAAAAALISAGRLKALAVTTKSRAKLLPDVPTVASQGYPDFDVSAWVVIAGPKNLPNDVVDRLSAAFAEATAIPIVQEKLIKAGAEPATSSPAELRAFLRAEATLWASVVKEANVTVN